MATLCRGTASSLQHPLHARFSESTANAGSLIERAGKFAADLAVNPLTYLVAIVFSVWLVNVLGESDLTIFVLAAFPIVGLTALSKSPIGEEVQKSLEAELPGALSFLHRMHGSHTIPSSMVKPMVNSASFRHCRA